ncbi:MAG: 4Fe-4S dicluster domain-containing protein [Armatimonadota bacterium]
MHTATDSPRQALALRQEDTRGFITALMGSTRHLIAPVRTLHGDLVFAEVDSAEGVELDYGNSLVAPTCYVLPQREVVFTYTMEEDKPPEAQAAPAPDTHLLFGVRPCDVAAIEYLDDFFMGGEYTDDVYARRREALTVVAMACLEPWSEACWCTCSHAGPVARSGYDLQLTLVGDTYLVEVGTQRGEQLAEMAGGLLRDAGARLLAERERLVEEAFDRFDCRGNIAQAMRWISGDDTPPELWQELGAKCFSCGSCSLVCPVCTCFDTHEHVEGGVGARIRCWDSCHYPGYSLEASGFNPRETEADRMFHYAHHKLCYDTFAERGRPGCVGCGRCVHICSAQIDLPRIAQMIRERGWQCREAEKATVGVEEAS